MARSNSSVPYHPSSNKRKEEICLHYETQPNGTLSITSPYTQPTISAEEGTATPTSSTAILHTRCMLKTTRAGATRAGKVKVKTKVIALVKIRISVIGSVTMRRCHQWSGQDWQVSWSWSLKRSSPSRDRDSHSPGSSRSNHIRHSAGLTERIRASSAEKRLKTS